MDTCDRLMSNINSKRQYSDVIMSLMPFLLALWSVAPVTPLQHTFNNNGGRWGNRTCSEGVLSTVRSVLDHPGTGTVIIIYDNADEACLGGVTSSARLGTRILMLSVGRVMEALTPLIDTLVLEENLLLMRSSLNFLLVCSASCIDNVLDMSIKLDSDVGKKFTLRHFSRWLLLPTDQTDHQPSTHLSLDNVAVINTHQISGTMSVSTLLWRRHGREWSDVFSGAGASLDDVFPNTKFGLNNRKLIVSSLEWLPFSKKVHGLNHTVYTGLSSDILEYVSRTLNFSYEYVEPPDLMWGHELDNGSWTGIVGSLQRLEADMSSVPYAFNIERSRVMSFTYSILVESSTVIYKRAIGEKNTWTALIACFKWEVFAVGGGVLVAVAAMYLTLLTVTPNNTISVRDMKDEKWTQTLMFAVLAPMMQGTKTPPSFHSGQVLFASWFLFCLIMTSIYRGNLMAFLTVDRSSVPFRNIQELADQDVYDVGAPVGSYISLIIQTSDQKVMKTLWEKILRTQAKSPQTGAGDYQYQLDRLHAGKFAYIQSGVAADVIMSTTCDLARLNEYLLPTTSSMVFPLHSPLSRLFVMGTMEVIENGLYQRYYDKWVPRPKDCTDDSISVGTHPISVDEFFGCLAACGAGVVVALLVLLSETYLHSVFPDYSMTKQRNDNRYQDNRT